MRDIQTIKQQIVNYVLALRKNVRLVEGDTEYDVAVESVAPLFYRYEVLLELEDRTRNLSEFESLIADEAFKVTLVDALGNKPDGTPYTMDDVNTLISNRLDAYVADFNIIRSSGTNATGLVTMYLADATPISWNNNTEFTSANGQTYQATSTIMNVIPNFSQAKGLYYVTITVQSSITGQVTNATAGSIRTVSPKPTSFSYCTNETAITGGSDKEEDLELIDRARTAWADRVNGSVGALDQLASSQTYVDDVLAQDQDDEPNGVYVGSVCDLFTQFVAENTELVEEFFYWPGESGNVASETFQFTPSKQPLVSTVNPVVFTYELANPITDPAIEHQVVPASPLPTVTILSDTGTYSGSVKAQDMIQVQQVLTIGQTAGLYQRKMKVLYVYDKNPYLLQSIVDDPANRMVGPQALVRKAVEIPIRVIVELAVSFGYDVAAVQAAVTSNIGVFFNGGTTSYGKQFARKKIGESIQHTDISQVILRTAGVVSYDTDTFYVINTVTGNLSDPTTIKSNQYATLFDVLYTFNTFNLSNFTTSF